MKLQFIVAFTVAAVMTLEAGSPRCEVNLRGRWRFEVGDDASFARPEFDDSSWEKIRVPDQWEDQGYPGYDGYAWYRTKFHLPGKLRDKSLMLYLGFIDDVDQVYINGQFLNGRGSDGPSYISAYNQRRNYQISSQMLNFDGENTIAVRVYDDWGDGGIVAGKIGIYSLGTSNPSLDFSGNWKFHEGDNLDWAEQNFDDHAWETLIVPAAWEAQKKENLDGYGWYRNRFVLPENMRKETLILFIGSIDDADELYMNGKKVNSTGRFPAEDYAEYNRRFYNHERIYYIPSEVIRWGEENTLALRVYDSGGEGGIVRGPIGITTRKEYHKFKRTYRNSNYDFSDVINSWFVD
jgi:beta-galactosidase/beta-glucuronidase